MRTTNSNYGPDSSSQWCRAGKARARRVKVEILNEKQIEICVIRFRVNASAVNLSKHESFTIKMKNRKKSNVMRRVFFEKSDSVLTVFFEKPESVPTVFFKKLDSVLTTTFGFRVELNIDTANDFSRCMYKNMTLL